MECGKHSTQKKYRRLLAESKVVFDIGASHSSPALLEALIDGAQIVKSPSINSKWIDPNDVVTFPEEWDTFNNIENNDKISSWVKDQILNPVPLGIDILNKYRNLHSLESSLDSIICIFDKYNVRFNR